MKRRKMNILAGNRGLGRDGPGSGLGPGLGPTPGLGPKPGMRLGPGLGPGLGPVRFQIIYNLV